MAYTRTEIITLVDSYTRKGTDKATLIDTLCDQALKYAALVYDFADICSLVTPATTITAADESMAIPSNTRTLLSVRLFNAAETASTYLKIKNKTWWDSHIVNPGENSQGWPEYALRQSTNLLFDRPSDALTAHFRITTIPSFASDATECPIDVLDNFVVAYVTAMVFKSIEEMENYYFWITQALGTKKQRDNNEPGGLLLQAISADKRSPAVEHKAGYPQGARNTPTIHTTGDLGTKSWF